MVNYLFVAEKPSMAKEIAEARADQLGVKASKTSSHFQVGDDAVTWLFGHMYETSPPEAYDPKYKNWNINDLPIIPDKWKLNLHADKKDHVSKIKGLIKSASNIVNAGDAAREGQLLVDELLIELGWQPFNSNSYRLWVSSFTRKDMLDALKNMKPNKEKEDLYNSAVCRQRADWLHGMNMSRLYTIKAQQSGSRGVVSVGRVQTPTLKIVVDRDREIENFKPVDHYLPQAIFKHQNGNFTASYILPDDISGLDSEGRLIDKSVADEIVKKIINKQGVITDYKSTDKSKSQPLPYSLSALQTECSAKFGLSAQETLDVAQRLYETHKVSTYPRSDSRYLPLSIYKEEAPTILNNLKKVNGDIGAAAENANTSIKSSAWNDSKVSDHHGIIPTTDATASKISSLTGIDKKVFDLIAKTFISQFYPVHRYKSLSAIIDVENEKFKATGRKNVDDGWKVVFSGEPNSEDEEDEDNQSLPPMSKGDNVEVKDSNTQSKVTKPPARFTDGTLIAAMTNIHKFVTDTEIKKKLKENDGLGTEATRASIIETLLKRNFLMRKGKKQLISTDTGRSVIDVLPDDITNPGLTAIWESYLDQVSKGSISLDKFMSVQTQTLRDRIEVGKHSTVKIKGKSAIRPIEGHGDKCPKCSDGSLITREIGKGKHKGKKFLSCSGYPECDYVQWTQEKIDPIEGHGDTCPTCTKGTMVTRVIRKGDNKGKKFLSCSAYPECNHVQWPQEKIKPIDGDGKQCPTCGDGVLKTRKTKNGKFFLSCNKYPDCSHAEWPQEKIPEMDGHGKQCEKCQKGTMVTRMIQKGDKKGTRFLSCNQYPNCNNAIWDNSNQKPKKRKGK